MNELRAALKEVCIQAELGDQKAIDLIDFIEKVAGRKVIEKEKESIEKYVFGSSEEKAAVKKRLEAAL